MTPPLPVDDAAPGEHPSSSSASAADGDKAERDEKTEDSVLAAQRPAASATAGATVGDASSVPAASQRGFRVHHSGAHSLPEAFSSVQVPFIGSMTAEESRAVELQRMPVPPHSSSSDDLSALAELNAEELPASPSFASLSTPSSASSSSQLFSRLPQLSLLSSLRSSKFWWRVRSLMSWLGVGLMISVGYMDPGNWQTDLSGGASFYYSLLFVILFANVSAILLQHLSLKLGIAAERDLAQAMRDAYSPRLCFFLWITVEIAIIATDLAEVTGSAIALQLLFGLPLPWGCVLTAADVLLLLVFQQRRIRYMEALVGALTLLIFVAFVYEIAEARPVWADVFFGFLPSAGLVTNSAELFNAIGILGATVMPHNLFLHSSLVQSRAYPRTVEGKQWALKYAGIDSAVSLTLAFFINAAILILAAAVFYTSGQQNVAELQDAYTLLSPTIGASAASTVFAVALLASGQQATITGTLAGQICMEALVDIRLKPWQRRLLTRCLAIVPAVLVTSIAGEQSVATLLIISQVILSFQLTFSIVPLVHFTSSQQYVGEAFVNSRWLCVLSVLLCVVITALNGVLIVEFCIDPGL